MWRSHKITAIPADMAATVKAAIKDTWVLAVGDQPEALRVRGLVAFLRTSAPS